MTKSTKHVLAIFLPVLLGLILCLFWEPMTGIPKQHSLWSMDASPLYSHDFKTQTWNELTGNHWRLDMLGMPGRTRVFQPDDLMKFIFPPLVYHLATWVGAFLLMTGAMMYFLYSYGIKGLKAAIPALAYGFSGYTFTLISAGHWGTPKTMAYAVLTMALIRNGIHKNTIIHFVLAGLTTVYGIINQQDVMGFLLILIAAYGLLQLILAWPEYQKSEETEPNTRNQKSKIRLLTGLILAAVVFSTVAYPFLAKTFFGTGGNKSTVEHREEQIKRTGGNQWEFITDWSLPPEQMLEFIAPSIFGQENVSRERPYWGRLGQSMNWSETKQGFRNFRQHNLYIGGIQLTFALYAIFLLFRRDQDGPSRKRRIEIMFWTGVTVLTILLAFGRYFPLYRLVFEVPILNKIRCPVKWVHLTEIAIVVLMGFGIHGLWQDLKDGRTKLLRKFFFGTSITAGLLLVAAGVASSSGFGLQPYWSSLGLATAAPQLREGMSTALLHGAVVFGALSAILWFIHHRAPTVETTKQNKRTKAATNAAKMPPPSFTLSALLVVLAIDLAVAHKPFIHVRDVSAYYAPNPVAEICLEHAPPYRIADYLTSRGKHDPLWRNFLMKGCDMLLPQAGQRPTKDLQKLMEANKSNPLALWKATSTRYIIGRHNQLAQLIQHPDILLRATFEVSRDSRIILSRNEHGPFLLLEYLKATPKTTKNIDVRTEPHLSISLGAQLVILASTLCLTLKKRLLKR